MQNGHSNCSNRAISGGGGSRNGSRRRQHSGNLATTSEGAETEGGGGGGGDEKKKEGGGSNGTTAAGTATASTSTCRDLDAGKLIGKLQKLVLHPIREIPTTTSTLLARLFARSAAASRVVEWWHHCAPNEDGVPAARAWFQRLRKPRSCENVFRTVSRKA